MARYRISMEIEADSEEDAMLDYNENIPEFEDFQIEELPDEED